jgi:hypothetical protein
MEESKPEAVDVRDVVREAIQEFVRAEQVKSEPAYKAELIEERKRREQLEVRLNDLVEENKRSRHIAEEAEKSAAVRAELQRMGVSKIDLAYRVVKDDVQRSEDGRLIAKGDQGERPLREYLTQFVNDNPELLPARIAGGSGTGPVQKATTSGSGLDLDRIRPGMSAEELERARQEIARVASQAMKGQ